MLWTNIPGSAFWKIRNLGCKYVSVKAWNRSPPKINLLLRKMWNSQKMDLTCRYFQCCSLLCLPSPCRESNIYWQSKVVWVFCTTSCPSSISSILSSLILLFPHPSPNVCHFLSSIALSFPAPETPQSSMKNLNLGLITSLTEDQFKFIRTQVKFQGYPLKRMLSSRIRSGLFVFEGELSQCTAQG